MATEFNITDAHRFFLGEDKVLRLQVFEEDLTTPLDVSGWNLAFYVRKKDKDADPALITKTLGAGIQVEGTFSSTPSENLQRVLIDIESDDTNGLKASSYRYSVKRVDVGSETILVFGSIVFLQATAH